jgi:hypothetical protein
MSTPAGEGFSHTGAGVEATKRLQHLLEICGGAELEDGQTNIDLFCPVFTAKDMEDRAAADRGGGVRRRHQRRPHGAGAERTMARGGCYTCASPTRRPNGQRRSVRTEVL